MRMRHPQWAHATFRLSVGRCVTIGRVMKEGQIIIGVLGALGRRLWINRAIRDAAFALCVILFCLICFKLIEPALDANVPITGTIVRIALLAALAAIIIEVARRCAQGVSTQQAAAQADARAHLKDELKSAYWFLSEMESSPFAQLQVHRAAATAAGLDLTMLAPRTLPFNAYAAAALGLLLATLMWMAPLLSRSLEFSHEAGFAAPGESADLRSLLKDAPHGAEIEKLDLALGKLQQTDASAEEKRRALADARDAIAQANMEASAAREGLARLAEALKSNPKFEAVALALNQGRVDEALELMRKHKADASGAREDKASEPADSGRAQESNIGQALETAGRDLASRNTVINQDALDRVSKALEKANESLETQGRVNSVKRRMEDNLIATSQRSPLTASQFDNRTNPPNPTPSPETGSSNVRGGALFRQAAVAREENDNARDGSQTGDASGESVALPLHGAAARRLDAQLKLETLLRNDDAGEEPNGKGDPGWFYSPSQEQKSMLQTENVRERAGYDQEAAINHDRVPVRQKNIVKNYFLNLHESEKK